MEPRRAGPDEEFLVEMPDEPLPPEHRGSFGIPVPGARHRKMPAVMVMMPRSLG
jgi:hypothetical protein